MRLFSLPSSQKAKFAVSVSKKQEKNASRRNRIRRRVYAVIQDNLSSIPHSVAVHFILQKRPGEDKHDITKDITYLLHSL